MTGCGVSIKSVVDNSSAREIYKNPLIVIPYLPMITERFSNKLKDNFENLFRIDQKHVEILLVENQNDELKLNSNTEIDNKINNAISNDDKDLLILFKPKKMESSNGTLQSVTYIIVGIDTKSKKEIWKAEFSSESLYGPSVYGEKSAKTIYERLKADKVL
jgi:hypothetical protein